MGAVEGMGVMGTHAQPYVSDMAKMLADTDRKGADQVKKMLIALDKNSYKAVNDLTRLLQDKDDNAKRKAYEVLNAIGKYKEVPEADRQAYEAWQKERSQTSQAKAPMAKGPAG